MSFKDKETKRKSLLSGVSIVAAAAAAFSGAPAHAQDDEEAIVVTGSRIPQPNLVTTSPVTQLTGEDITTQGATRVEDLTNELPQVFGAQSSGLANSSNGTATVDLRGLGAQRTLVLINGRRMGYGDITSSAADLNQIPGALVERVEVLTGGASAVYGSDAISGVVNFIMRDDFEGFRVDAQYGFYNHSNDSEDGYIREVIAARGATNPSQFQLPADEVNTGYGQEITAIFGASTSDGRGNVTAYMGYRNDDEVLQRDFDYSACSLGPDSTAAVAGVPAGERHWTCGGSGTTSPARITAAAAFGGSGADVTPRGAGDAFIPYTTAHQYNFGPINHFQRPAERYSLGAFARYEINDRVEAYSQLMFSHQTSLAQIAPSGAFYAPFAINCGDPNLGAVRADELGCSAGQIAGDDTLTVLIGRRNTEGGGRIDDRQFESYRGTIGFRGPINESWDYDLYAQYGSVRVDQVYRNDFSAQRIGRALDVVDPGLDGAFFDDPTTVADETLDNAAGGGTPICRVADPNAPFVDAACAPYDIWNTGGVTAAALGYLQIPGVRTGEVTQQVVSGSITGDVGFGSPAAESNFQTAVGFEYRRDELGTDVDVAFATGDLSGQGGPTPAVAGDIDVFELFAEARLPLVEGAAFAELLSIDAAYRFSSYSNGTTTDTYKVGGDWAPTEDIRFRASYQQAVRAPNIIELFFPSGLGLFDMGDDPCDGTDPNADGAAPIANCVGTNPWQVTLAQYNSGDVTSPAGQYNGLFGGNTALAPEEAETTTYGVVLTPRFLPGFTLSVDYFNIEVTNYIQALDPTTTIGNCFLLNDLPSCALITRETALGSLFVQGSQVLANNTNLGGVSTAGIDINGTYSMDVGSMGGLSFSLIGTILEELTVSPGGIADDIACEGTFSAACSQIVGASNPEWRHRFRISWETPWEFQLNGTWRYYGSADNNSSGAATDLDTEMEEVSYFDLSGNWDVYDNTNIRFGINNILDQDPPLSDNVGTTGNGNTYPQVYDALGRYIFIGATVDF